MRIDAHQHFWQYHPVRDAWITENIQVIRHDFMPTDLKPLLDKHQIDGCVAVQADQSESENHFLLDLAEQHAWIKGVVGWVDLSAYDAKEQLDALRKEEKFKGVRHILQGEPDGFMTSKAFIEGVTLLHEMDLTYDILTRENQLPEVIEFVTRLPEMRLVVDHISKPNIAQASFEDWSKYMKSLAAFEHVHIKLSGLSTEANWQNWQPDDLVPYVEFCLEHFGPKRLLFGSDWPVCLISGGYLRNVRALEACLGNLSIFEQADIFGLTAKSFYQLN
jgi:L-fuconolactonase